MNSHELTGLIDDPTRADPGAVITLSEPTGSLRSAQNFTLFKRMVDEKLQNRQPRGYANTLLSFFSRHSRIFVILYFVALALLGISMLAFLQAASAATGQGSNSDEKKYGRDVLISAGVIFALSVAYMVAVMEYMEYMEEKFGGTDVSRVEAHFKQIEEAIEAITEENFLSNENIAEIVEEFLERPFSHRGNYRFFAAVQRWKEQPPSQHLSDTSEDTPSLRHPPV